MEKISRREFFTKLPVLAIGMLGYEEPTGEQTSEDRITNLETMDEIHAVIMASHHQRISRLEYKLPDYKPFPHDGEL